MPHLVNEKHVGHVTRPDRAVGAIINEVATPDGLAHDDAHRGTGAEARLPRCLMHIHHDNIDMSYVCQMENTLMHSVSKLLV